MITKQKGNKTKTLNSGKKEKKEKTHKKKKRHRSCNFFHGKRVQKVLKNDVQENFPPGHQTHHNF